MVIRQPRKATDWFGKPTPRIRATVVYPTCASCGRYNPPSRYGPGYCGCKLYGDTCVYHTAFQPVTRLAGCVNPADRNTLYHATSECLPAERCVFCD